MKALILASLFTLGACTSNFPQADVQQSATSPASSHPEGALLLVSLDDGQMVMQHVDIDAEICMKSNADPTTRCFKRGEAIYDPATATVVAYQLERSELSLFAKNP